MSQILECLQYLNIGTLNQLPTVSLNWNKLTDFVRYSGIGLTMDGWVDERMDGWIRQDKIISLKSHLTFTLKKAKLIYKQRSICRPPL